MNTQSIFETESSKEEIVDIANKPTLFDHFIKEFDEETTQKESLNEYIVSIIFPQKKNKNNEDLISKENELTDFSKKSKNNKRKIISKVDKQFALTKKTKKKGIYSKKPKNLIKKSKSKSKSKIKQSKFKIESSYLRKKYMIKEKKSSLDIESFSDSASIFSEEEKNEKKNKEKNDNNEISNNLSFSLLCYEFNKINLNDNNVYSQDSEFKIITLIKIEEIMFSSEKEKFFGIISFKNKNEENGNLFPLFNNLEQDSYNFYEIINNMKNENKYFECELNRKYMNYKNIFCSPIFFLNKVLDD